LTQTIGVDGRRSKKPESLESASEGVHSGVEAEEVMLVRGVDTVDMEGTNSSGI